MIKERLGIDVVLEPTNKTGQFDVMADGERIASRGGNVATRVLFGAGFPHFGQVVDVLAMRLTHTAQHVPGKANPARGPD